MGGIWIWPDATPEEKKDGWTLSYRFLQKVKDKMDENDSMFSGSLEVIENCLLSASTVEIDTRT